MIILGKSDRGSARTSSCPSDHSPIGANFLTNSTPLIINHDVRFGTWDLGSTSSLGLCWGRIRRSCCCMPLDDGSLASPEHARLWFLRCNRKVALSEACRVDISANVENRQAFGLIFGARFVSLLHEKTHFWRKFECSEIKLMFEKI